jgi:hypothetical protein
MMQCGILRADWFSGVASPVLCAVDSALVQSPDHKILDPLPIFKAIAIQARVADALGYLRQSKVVQRVIKLVDNRHIPNSVSIKVSGFNVARELDSSITVTGLVLGTPLRMRVARFKIARWRGWSYQ